MSQLHQPSSIAPYELLRTKLVPPWVQATLVPRAPLLALAGGVCRTQTHADLGARRFWQNDAGQPVGARVRRITLDRWCNEWLLSAQSTSGVAFAGQQRQRSTALLALCHHRLPTNRTRIRSVGPHFIEHGITPLMGDRAHALAQ